MAYSPTTWVQGTTPLNATNMNHLETQYTEAINSFEQDLFAAFVLSGLVATKDGTIANQLDITAGVAFLLQSVDNSLRRRAPVSSTQTTSALSSTYNLYLQPDGTWYWSTSNAPAANSLYVAQVTTDGSGNISTVTDKRTLATTLLAGLQGALQYGQAVGGTYSYLWFTSPQVVFRTPISGATPFGFVFQTWTGSTNPNPFSIGGQFAGALSWIDNLGNLTAASVAKVGGQATAGSYGVVPLVAQALDQHITVTTVVHVLDFTAPATGWYRISAYTYVNNGTAGNKVTVVVTHTDGHTGALFGATMLPNLEVVLAGGQAVDVVPDGANTTVGNTPLDFMPILIYAQNATTISCRYQDPTNTPNDFVTFFIERMA